MKGDFICKIEMNIIQNERNTSFTVIIYTDG